VLLEESELDLGWMGVSIHTLSAASGGQGLRAKGKKYFETTKDDINRIL
jgi:hypothetical protein